MDGKTNELQAAQKLRKMASRAVRQEWNDSALKPNKAPLDAICEAIWNDMSKDGEAFFDKKRGRGLMNFVARFVVPLFAADKFMNVIITAPNISDNTNINIKTVLATIGGFTGLFGVHALTNNLFTTEEGISKNIRKHLTQKAKQRRNTPSE